MSKIFKLKQFLTVEDATRHLSQSLEEPVSLPDFYRFVVDEHLTMSVRFNSQAFAQSGKYVCSQDDESKALVFDKLVHVIDGVWDLAMIGTESKKIEALYQEEVGGLQPMLAEVNGFCLKRDEVIYKLQESLHLEGNKYNLNALESRRDHLLKLKGLSADELNQGSNSLVFDCFSTSELDEFMSLNEALIQNESGEYAESDAHLALEDVSYQFVIRTNELTRFVQALQDEPSSVLQEDKPLLAKERNTLLVLIGALCDELKIDPTERGVVSALTRITELAGTTLSGEVIRQILLKIPAAMERKRN